MDSIISKMRQTGTPISEVESDELEVKESVNENEELIRTTFNMTAGIYWGKIGTVRVTPLRQSEGGTKYYLVVADTVKNREKVRLLQVWFISKEGTAKPVIKKTLDIPEELCDEIGMMIMDDFEC